MPNNKPAIPDNIAAQIEEWSMGGFLLFTFDSEGNPQVTSSFDHQIFAAGMQYYVTNWVKAIDNLNVDMIAEAIHQSRRRRRK